MALSSVTTTAEGKVDLALSLTSSGTQPAGLQWTLEFATSDFTAMTVTAGPSAATAAAELTCNAESGKSVCLLSGLTYNTMADGVVAIATLTPSANTNLTKVIGVTNAISASLSGDDIITAATGGTVTVPAPTSIGISSLACTPSSVMAAGTTTCSVTLNQTAPVGGTVVTLSDDSTALTVPASVTVVAGGKTGTFT
ncbi:MAG TPA: hypothetical protein VGM51_02430, partial [Armatimonadota bacterium]